MTWKTFEELDEAETSLLCPNSWWMMMMRRRRNCLMDRETDAVEHHMLQCYIIAKSRWTAYVAEIC